jgi:hypothetical protein
MERRNGASAQQQNGVLERADLWACQGPAGSISCSACHLGSVVASNKPEDVPVSMTPEVVVEGRVIDPKGMPVVGAQVAHAASPHEVPTLPEWARTITDPQGRFRLVLMPSGPSDLIVVDHNGRRIGSLTPSGGDTVLHRR